MADFIELISFSFFFSLSLLAISRFYIHLNSIQFVYRVLDLVPFFADFFSDGLEPSLVVHLLLPGFRVHLFVLARSLRETLPRLVTLGETH